MTKEKNPAAVALGKMRVKKLRERLGKEGYSKYMSDMAKARKFDKKEKATPVDVSVDK